MQFDSSQISLITNFSIVPQAMFCFCTVRHLQYFWKCYLGEILLSAKRLAHPGHNGLKIFQYITPLFFAPQQLDWNISFGCLVKSVHQPLHRPFYTPICPWEQWNLHAFSCYCSMFLDFNWVKLHNTSFEIHPLIQRDLQRYKNVNNQRWKKSILAVLNLFHL